MEGYQDVKGLEQLALLEGEAERAGMVQPGEEEASGKISV